MNLFQNLIPAKNRSLADHGACITRRRNFVTPPPGVATMTDNLQFLSRKQVSK